MLKIDYFGPDNRFFQNAFFDNNNDQDVDLPVITPTLFETENGFTGNTSVFTGSNFNFGSNGPTSGRINSIEFTDGAGNTVARYSGIDWDLPDFSDMLSDISNGDFASLSGFYSSQDIEIDASAATSGLNMGQTTFDRTFVASDMTVTGSDFDDLLFGWGGDDIIKPGDNDGEDRIVASDGNDIIDFTTANTGDLFNSYVLSYGGTGGVDATLNTMTNSGTLVTAFGTDTLVEMNRVTDTSISDSFVLDGSSFDDTFDVKLTAGHQLSVVGGEGNDDFTYRIGDGGKLRIDYSNSGNGSPTGGINMNLATGDVSDDGWGTQDTINIIGNNPGGSVLEIRATDNDDVITGGDWNEVYILRGGNDVLDGGAGNADLVRFDRGGMTMGVSVDLANPIGTAQGAFKGTVFSHNIEKVEDVRGTRDMDDVIRGDGANNMLRGLGGNDTLDGRDGRDELLGEDGDDTLIGGRGNDTLDGGNGRDDLDGGGGADILRGGDGLDTLKGGAGDDELFGGDRADTLEGGANRDRLFGEDGNDRLFGNAGFDLLQGGDGEDLLNGGENADRLFGNRGNDRLFGEAGNDRMFGGIGFDRLNGGDGRDFMRGGGQADNLTGGADDDQLFGDAGNDRLFGGADNDILRGGDGNDGLFGQQGDDELLGEAGNDSLWGGSGRDELNGGANDDILRGGAGFDTLIGGSGDDTLSGGFNADLFVFADGFGGDRITDFDATNNAEKIDLAAVTAITDFTDLEDNHMVEVFDLATSTFQIVISGDPALADELVLENVRLADLDTNDFTFTV